jgi:hypothetical protein
VGKCKGMRHLERPKHRWENYIKVDLKEIRFEDVDSIIWVKIGTTEGLS